MSQRKKIKQDEKENSCTNWRWKQNLAQTNCPPPPSPSKIKWSIPNWRVWTNKGSTLTINHLSYLPSVSIIMLHYIFPTGLPSSVKKALEKWNNIVLTNFPSATSWKPSSCLIEVGTESFLDSLVSAHLFAVCSGATMEIAPALKHTLYSLVQLAADLLS